MKSFTLKISLICIYFCLSQGCDTYAFGTVKIANDLPK